MKNYNSYLVLVMDSSLVRLKNNNTTKSYGYGGIDGTYNESPLAYQYTSGSAGMGYGFIRSNRNGQEILKHEGALPSGSTTTLFLMPKEGLGVYVATNSLNPLPFNFEEEFLNSFYPNKSNSFNEIKPNPSKDFSKYEGTYRSYDGIAKSNIMKIGSLFDPSMDMKIKDNKDGVFARKDGRGDFAFKTDSNGKVTYAFKYLFYTFLGFKI